MRDSPAPGQSHTDNPKRLKPKTMPRSSTVSLSVLWSARLLGGLLSDFRLPGVCMWGWCCHSHAAAPLARPLPTADACRGGVLSALCLNLLGQASVHSGRVQLPSQSWCFSRLGWQISPSPCLYVLECSRGLFPQSITLPSLLQTTCRPPPAINSLPGVREICCHMLAVQLHPNCLGHFLWILLTWAFLCPIVWPSLIQIYLYHLQVSTVSGTSLFNLNKVFLYIVSFQDCPVFQHFYSDMSGSFCFKFAFLG